jgi:hypothetical protein
MNLQSDSSQETCNPPSKVTCSNSFFLSHTTDIIANLKQIRMKSPSIVSSKVVAKKGIVPTPELVDKPNRKASGVCVHNVVRDGVYIPYHRESVGSGRHLLICLRNIPSKISHQYSLFHMHWFVVKHV